MNEQINDRKLEHLQALADDAGIERGATGFDTVSLTHRALPELDYANIDPSIDFLGKRLDFPLLISSMTGGDSEHILAINQRLAEAAEACGVAMAVGSQRVMFTHERAEHSFALRQFAPNTVLLANIGAVQLNYDFGVQHCQKAIDIMDADGLYLHLNPLQEAVQPEGDRNFSGLTEKIAEISQQLPVPVLLKEVGAGLSSTDIHLGLKAGITHFDVAGRGGTSWSRIEYHRRQQASDTLGLLFQDWGLTTVEALRQANHALLTQHPSATLIASGGIRSGLDMAKAMVLGARLCGVAAPLLTAAKISTQAVIEQIETFKREYVTALFLLGCDNSQAIIGQSALLANPQ